MSVPRFAQHPSGALLATVLVLAVAAWLALRTPAPAPAPAGERAGAGQAFSATRASADLALLAQAPRPIASSANAAARTLVLARLRALGREGQVQRALVQKNYVDYNANVEATIGVVHNVLLHLPGAAPDRLRRPSLLLVAHLDSERDSLGASQAAPVAALLDVVRALRAGRPLENDVLVLFADGDRVGGLGMQAFVEQHPWARSVGLVLRFDGGASGPLTLYNTAHANGAAIEGWQRAAPELAGASLLHAIRPLAPGAQRIGALELLGVPVLQFAPTLRPFERADARDTPAQVDAATLAETGTAMLRLVRHFGTTRIDPRPGQGQVMFALPALGTVHYSVLLVWPLTLCIALLLARSVRSALARGMRDTALLQAFFMLPTLVVTLGVGAWQLWENLPGLHDAWNPASPAHRQHALLYLVALAALCSAVFIAAQRQLQRLVGTPALMLAGLMNLTVLLLLASALAPGVSYLLAWPLLGALVSFAAWQKQEAGRHWPRARGALLVAGVLPALLLGLPALRDSYLLLSPARMNVPIAILALLLGVSTLLLAQQRRYLVRPLLVTGLIALVLAGSAAPLPPAAPPVRADALVYYKDMPSWDAYWLHPAGPLDPWQARLFATLKTPHVFVNVFGWQSPRQWYAWAPRDGLKFPLVRVLRNTRTPQRLAEFTLVSENRAPEIRMQLDGARPTRVTMNGRTLLDKEAKSLTILAYGMQDTLLHVQIAVRSDPIFSVRIEEILPGLPTQLLPPRPPLPALMPASGKSIAADTLWFY